MSEITRLRRLKDGVCTDCGGPRDIQIKNKALGTFRRMCSVCLDKNSKKQEKYRKERLAKGFCSRCNIRKYFPGLRFCKPCLEYGSRMHKIRNANHFFIRRASSGMYDGTVGIAKTFASLWKEQRGVCALTGTRLTRRNAELDHIIPVSKGGTNDRSNLRWTTKDANQAKRGLSDFDFISLCKAVVDFSENKIPIQSLTFTPICAKIEEQMISQENISVFKS